MSIEAVSKNAGKKAIDFAKSYFFDMHHKKEAMRAVDVIQKYNSRELTDGLRKTIDDYSVDVLGSKKFAPWLYVYSLVSGEFREGWIPDNFFGRRVMPRVNKDLYVVTEFKTFSNIILNAEALPDVGYFIDGIFYDRTFSIVEMETLRKKLFENEEFVFAKKDGSAQGRGVVKMGQEEFTRDSFTRFGNCVIQSPIRQHPFFDEIISGSIATVRITTVKETCGTIGMRAAYLRLGRKDTSWVQSSNSIRVAVVDADGSLDSVGYTQDWRRWTQHPDTGFSFEGERIPNFRGVVEDCIALHRKVPHMTIIGWDTTVGDDGKTKIIEWNGGHCDIKFSEATTGPCFRGLGWERYKGH